MDASIEQLILSEIQAIRTELQAFRVEVHEWQQEAGERVATLEAQVKSGVTGNGQPSRLTVVETRVAVLERGFWRMVGACSAVWTILTVVLHFLPWGKH